jgi:hypothetical protein
LIILEGSKELGPTQKRLQEFRMYDKTVKEIKTKQNNELQEPFIENRHPKVLL